MNYFNEIYTCKAITFFFILRWKMIVQDQSPKIFIYFRIFLSNLIYKEDIFVAR